MKKVFMLTGIALSCVLLMTGCLQELGPTGSATVGNVDISGVMNNPIVPTKVVITLSDDVSFLELGEEYDVGKWFLNYPEGSSHSITYKATPPVNKGDTTMTIEVSGSPHGVTAEPLKIVIFGDAVSSNQNIRVGTNPNAKWVITDSGDDGGDGYKATVADVEITGTAGLPMADQDVVIRLEGGLTFKDIAADADVSGWFEFEPRPTNVAIKIKDAVADGATVATITISGTPNVGQHDYSNEPISIKVYAAALNSNKKYDVEENPKAKWAITESEENE
jgi:hypothetical protein